MCACLYPVSNFDSLDREESRLITLTKVPAISIVVLVLVFFSGSREVARATVVALAIDLCIHSQAAAVGGNEEGGRNDIHEDEHDLKKGALVVCVRVSGLADVSGGTGADLSITAKSDD